MYVVIYAENTVSIKLSSNYFPAPLVILGSYWIIGIDIKLQQVWKAREKKKKNEVKWINFSADSEFQISGGGSGRGELVKERIHTKVRGLTREY